MMLSVSDRRWDVLEYLVVAAIFSPGFVQTSEIRRRRNMGGRASGLLVTAF